VLAGLSPRIAAAPDAGRLLAEVVAELRDTLGLAGAALRDASGEIVAGAPEPAHTVMPLVAYGRLAGDLLYCEPVTSLRPADRRVLDDLAAQLALLMHARALTDDLRRARERLVLAREEERRRLRRDLHDGLGPALAGIMLKADNARALVAGEPEAAARDLVVLRDDIRAAIDDVRRVVEGLRPPAIDDLGLEAAVREMISRLGSSAGTSFSVVVPEPLPAVPAAVEVALYRIVSEAVTNVVRHAQASACRVTISVGEQAFVAAVSDDGTGFPAPGPGSGPGTRSGPGPGAGHGLVTMRERAEELGGTLQIGSDVDGTSVIARLPLAAGSDSGSGA
jgi:signal transduction histidine kinase